MKRVLLPLVPIALGIASIAHAADYLPLIPGSSWDYLSPSGPSETASVVAPTLILDAEIPTIAYGPSTFNEGLHQFWSCEPAGDVILHGFNRELDGFGRIYDPGFEFVNLPLFVGKTWISSVEVLTYPELEPEGSLTLEFEVVSESIVSVPAGDFPAFEISYTVLSGGIDPNFDIVGRVGGAETDWWTESLGRVQYMSFDLYQLTEYRIPSTPVSESSWSRIKLLFAEPIALTP